MGQSPPTAAQTEASAAAAARTLSLREKRRNDDYESPLHKLADHRWPRFVVTHEQETRFEYEPVILKINSVH